MKIYLKLEAPFEWVRVNGKQVEAFGEVPSLSDYPIGDEEQVIGVVSGEWVTTHRVTLPAKTRKQFNAALPYALEESISEEVENMHFVAPNWKAGEEVLVSVVSKVKMKEWQSLANDSLLPIQQLLPEHALVPFHDAADCSIALTDSQLLAHHRDGHGVTIDSDFLDVWLMDVPMDAIIAVNDEALTEQLIREHSDRDVRHWAFGNKMAHWLEYRPNLGLDLWADKYRPKVSRMSKRTFMVPAALLLAAVILKVGYDSYRYIALHAEIASIQAESQQILKERFPVFQNVEPGTERELMEQAMARMGGPDLTKSMHSTLADASKVLGSQKVGLNNLVFRNDEMILTALLNDYSQVDVLTKQFNKQRSLSASLQSSATEDGKVIAKVIASGENELCAAELHSTKSYSTQIDTKQMDQLKKYWLGLQPRERIILAGGGAIVLMILVYALLFQPLYKALNHMQTALPDLRTNLVWMRQQSEALERSGGKVSGAARKGAGQSLLSVIEQTAKRARVRKAIQQMVPAQNGTEVRVVLEEANFNQWLRWIDDLYKQYGVDIKQVTAERDEDKPNIAEIRVTFIRSG